MRRKAPELQAEAKSSFLTYERDIDLILRRLFVDNKAVADKLKRLLVIQEPDCLLDDNAQYANLIKNYSVKKLKNEGYIKLVPRLALKEHEPIKSYIVVSIDDYYPSPNTEFRDCVINFVILCEYDCMEMINYQNRAVKIAGYIDGAINETQLTNIGRIEFVGSQTVTLNEYWGGVILQYAAIHENFNDSDESIEV